MSQRINLLLLLIVDTVAQVSAKGRWTPYFDLGSRHSRASLYFRPADFDYSKPPETQPSIESYSSRLIPNEAVEKPQKHYRRAPASQFFARVRIAWPAGHSRMF